jgi:peptidase E
MLREMMTIVVLGGGGFSTGDAPLDDWVLSHARRSPPRVLFVPTASGDAEAYVATFSAAMAARGLDAGVLRLFDRRVVEDLGALVRRFDVVYVGGGSTLNLLLVWRAHGLDRALADAARDGVVLAGVSAGMNCWFEASVTDSYGVGRADPLRDGLGLLGGSACPHFHGEPARRPAFHALVAGGALPAGLAVDDGCAVRFADGRPVDAAASARGAGAWRVSAHDGRAVEAPLTVAHLAH